METFHQMVRLTDIRSEMSGDCLLFLQNDLSQRLGYIRIILVFCDEEDDVLALQSNPFRRVCPFGGFQVL